MHEDHSTEKRNERKDALIDFLFLVGITWLYVTSVLCFPIGIVLGIVLMVGSHTKKARKMGLTALILGIVGFVLAILWFFLLYFLGSSIGGFPFGF